MQVGGNVFPAMPNALALDPAFDSGTLGDGITNVNRPTITRTAEPASTVTILEGSAVFGTTIAGTNGSWSFTTGVLVQGPHLFSATARRSNRLIGMEAAGSCHGSCSRMWGA